jgi:protoporphyrinogen/coproporphyrinogen III oxidase
VRRDGDLMDTGASALGSTYHAYLALARELGIGAQRVLRLVTAND